MQHGINGCRKESQISEPADATIRKKPADLLHLIRREAVSFANLKTFVPDLSFADSFFGHNFFAPGGAIPKGWAEQSSLCPGNLDINLFGYSKGIINLDAEIAHGTFNLCVPE